MRCGRKKDLGNWARISVKQGVCRWYETSGDKVSGSMGRDKVGDKVSRGKVSGDKVSGDKVSSDKVSSDKVNGSK